MASCTVEKRHYFKGYHIDWRHAQSSNKRAAEEPIAESTHQQTLEVEKEIGESTSLIVGDSVASIEEREEPKVARGLSTREKIKRYSSPRAIVHDIKGVVDFVATDVVEEKKEEIQSKIHPGAIASAAALVLMIVGLAFSFYFAFGWILVMGLSLVTRSDFKHGDTRRGKKLNDLVLVLCLLLLLAALFIVFAFLLFFGAFWA